MPPIDPPETGRAIRLWALLLFVLMPPLRAQQPPPSVEVMIPVVGNVNGVGAVKWKTDIEIDNNSGQASDVFLSLPTVPGEPFYSVTLAPGETLHATDVVGQIFGIDSALSPLLVTMTGRRALPVRAIAYGIRDSGTTTPELIPTIVAGTTFPQRTLVGLSFSDDYRTNVGILNLASRPATFILALQRLEGRNLAVSRFTVPPNTLYHVPVQSLFPLITHGENISIIVETDSTNSYVYASVIRNDSHEARFIQPAFGAVLPDSSGPAPN